MEGVCGWLNSNWVSSVYFVIFLVLSKYACFNYANLHDEICFASGYNIQNLTKAWYWYYTPTNKDVCPSNLESCQFSFSICNVLPFDCQGCSVAVNSTENNITSIGEYDNTLNPIASVPGDRSFTIFYDTSILNFNCDLSARWIPESGNTRSPVPDSANTNVKYNSSEDIYTFIFQSAEACGVPATVKPFEPNRGSGLSTGSILLLIFFPTVALYFLLGIILNKLGGAHGKELVPNYEFWNSLPGLIADGVVFTWSMITCQGSKGVSGYDSI